MTIRRELARGSLHTKRACPPLLKSEGPISGSWSQAPGGCAGIRARSGAQRNSGYGNQTMCQPLARGGGDIDIVFVGARVFRHPLPGVGLFLGWMVPLRASGARFSITKKPSPTGTEEHIAKGSASLLASPFEASRPPFSEGGSQKCALMHGIRQFHEHDREQRGAPPGNSPRKTSLLPPCSLRLAKGGRFTHPLHPL